MSSAPTLLLFDIDGTLLSGATGAHRRALEAALLDVHGLHAASLAEPPSPAGRTDGEIARLILRGCGVEEARIDALASEVRRVCCERYAVECEEDLAATVLPGVDELLTALSQDERFVLSLLTGNFEPVARRKLAAAGIGGFFGARQGAFGSDSEARIELPAIARRRAGTDASAHPRKRTVVIGDTPRDIACARADRVGCIAVATGQFGAGELVEADAVAADALAVRALLAGGS